MCTVTSICSGIFCAFLKIPGISNIHWGKEIIHIKVFDISGKPVYTSGGAIDKTYAFGYGFIPGIYLVEVTQGSLRSTVKVVKQ